MRLPAVVRRPFHQADGSRVAPPPGPWPLVVVREAQFSASSMGAPAVPPTAERMDRDRRMQAADAPRKQPSGAPRRSQAHSDDKLPPGALECLLRNRRVVGALKQGETRCQRRAAPCSCPPGSRQSVPPSTIQGLGCAELCCIQLRPAGIHLLASRLLKPLRFRWAIPPILTLDLEATRRAPVARMHGLQMKGVGRPHLTKTRRGTSARDHARPSCYT